MKTYSVILIGAGDRGARYVNEMNKFPDKYKIVGVAEALEGRRKGIQEKFGLPDEACFESWEEILSQPKMADVAIIATMDNMHYEPAMKAIELGYNLLIEKPVAQTAKECADIAVAAKNKGVKVLVCHVLRYTPFYKRVKEIILDGTIGDVMSVIGVEAVGDVHQTHSYVRGNWHCEEDTTPMLLAKCCHDLDIIQWLVDKPCKKVQSFGDLTYFKSENAPEGAPERCFEGNCPIADTCPYNSEKIYCDENCSDWFKKACSKGFAKAELPTPEEIRSALRVNDYGLCVFHAHNDVVDHQIVNMEFEGSVTASLTMNAFNTGGRYIRVFGTKGELYANMSDKEITVNTFADKRRNMIKVQETEESILGGHGGGDTGIVIELYDYLDGSYNGYCAADIQTSVNNHLIGFAAEKSRHNDTVESVADFAAKFGMTNAY